MAPSPASACPHSFAKRVVYTCVFGRYDFVRPPKCREAETDYILICDDASWRVSGWKTWAVDPKAWGSATAANRYFKFFAHELFPNCDYSCYIDGNSRIIGPLDPLFRVFTDSRACLGLQKHGFRSSVAEEIVACSAYGKLADPAVAEAEYKYYHDQGFDDSLPLTGNNVLLRWHHHPVLAEAMALWWECFEKAQTRDQLSLPFVRWKTGMPCYFLGFVFNDPNPYLYIQRHRTQYWRSNLLRYCEARSTEGWFFRLLFSIGHRFERARRNG